MVDRAASPHTGRDWMARVDRRLSLLERHRHPTPITGGETPPPTGGGALLAISVARGANQVQLDVTTGDGSGNPYTRVHFQNYVFLGIDGGTHGMLPPVSMVTQPDAFGFDVAVTGFYQAYIEIGFSFLTSGPEMTHWRFNTYDDYFEYGIEPHTGWGVAFGQNGGAQTFVTPPFYEPAWDEDDGTHYMSLFGQWRGLGYTIGSQFGGLDVTNRITVVRLL